MKCKRDRLLCMYVMFKVFSPITIFRMDLLEVPGKSKKNATAYILFTPDVTSALDVLVKTRYSELISVPRENPYLFARLNALTPLSGGQALSDMVRECPGLLRPERITTTSLRKYIATVSQVIVLQVCWYMYVMFVSLFVLLNFMPFSILFQSYHVGQLTYSPCSLGSSADLSG